MSGSLACIPAIDLRQGRCVRLLQGEFARETVYGDPVELARTYAEAGAAMLHVVDLDAARTGVAVNRSVVLDMVKAAGIPVQYGGGIRDAADALAALEAGIDRVVLGTAAVERPELAVSLARRFPGRVVVGLDHRRVAGAPGGPPRREVAVRGWEQGGGVELLEALGRLHGEPVAAAVVTDISRDGTLAGPDIEGYRELLAATSVAIIASGGVGRAEDLADLARLESGGRRLAGAIVGRALLDGRMTLAEAVAAGAW